MANMLNASCHLTLVHKQTGIQCNCSARFAQNPMASPQFLSKNWSMTPFWRQA